MYLIPLSWRIMYQRTFLSTLAPIEAYIPEVASAPTPPLPPSFLSPQLRFSRLTRRLERGYCLLLPGPTMARSVDCNFVDTMGTRFRDIERWMMTALEMANMRASYQVDVRSRESSEFYLRHRDAQKDRAAVRAEIEALEAEARIDTLEDTSSSS
uniref:Uncharacterized protein n=1 Tax=Tanacetum cinerariifolium TaxID=118510 RepID=A0A6L2M4T7_TANCI|nr:hypothetical protein [Tanacetum cinerariifolium]